MPLPRHERGDCLFTPRVYTRESKPSLGCEHRSPSSAEVSEAIPSRHTPPYRLASVCLLSRPPVPQSRLRRAKYALPHVGQKPPRDPLLSRRETLLHSGRLLLTKWDLRCEGFPIKRPSPLFVLTYWAQCACVLFTETFITNLFQCVSFWVYLSRGPCEDREC